MIAFASDSPHTFRNCRLDASHSVMPCVSASATSPPLSGLSNSNKPVDFLEQSLSTPNSRLLLRINGEIIRCKANNDGLSKYVPKDDD
eukprot:scaffold118130_cov40-Prasinocladus_malaysianus.AAC.2